MPFPSLPRADGALAVITVCEGRGKGNWQAAMAQLACTVR